jgi:hypothetical protein
MAKRPGAKGITLRDVVNHITHSKQQLSSQIQEVDRKLSGRMDRMDSRMDRMERSIEWIDVHVMNIEGRLNTIEVAIVEQKHEKRICRIERHLHLSEA